LINRYKTRPPLQVNHALAGLEGYDTARDQPIRVPIIRIEELSSRPLDDIYIHSYVFIFVGTLVSDPNLDPVALPGLWGLVKLYIVVCAAHPNL
jgi:hypothetical protein